MLFFSYLRIMKQILLFNPEHDLALANGDRHFIAPRNIREMAHDLADIMEAILPSSDSESSFISPLASAHPVPWGWDPAVVEQFKRMGITAQELPTDDALAALSRRSERITAHQILCNFRKAHTDNAFVGESLVARTFDEIADFAERHQHILLKAPLSGSGKGLRHVNKEGLPLSPSGGGTPESSEQSEGGMLSLSSSLKKVESWANALIRRHGYLTAEPYYNKVQDFAMEFIADATGCHFIGYSYFITDGHGRYIASRLMSDAKAEDLLCTYVPRKALHKIRQWMILHHTDIIPSEWDTTRHPLPFGIDMMIVRESKQSTVNSQQSTVNHPDSNSEFRTQNSKFTIHPCIEINLRMNMGIIAHEIYRHHLTPDAEGMFRIARFHDNASLRAFHDEQTSLHPAIYLDNRLASGYKAITPINTGTTHLAYISCE
jgi:hypothetical protein